MGRGGVCNSESHTKEHKLIECVCVWKLVQTASGILTRASIDHVNNEKRLEMQQSRGREETTFSQSYPGFASMVETVDSAPDSPLLQWTQWTLQPQQAFLRPITTIPALAPPPIAPVAPNAPCHFASQLHRPGNRAITTPPVSMLLSFKGKSSTNCPPAWPILLRFSSNLLHFCTLFLRHSWPSGKSSFSPKA